MNCEQIQPDLLDYGRGLLSGPDARRIRTHIEKCPECAALLEEEMAFSAKLAAVPVEAPANDVWALVRARTRPRTLRPLAWLRSFVAAPVVIRRAVAAVAAAAVVAVTAYSFRPEPPPAVPSKNMVPAAITVKWSDDPLGDHTDAMVKYIDNM